MHVYVARREHKIEPAYVEGRQIIRDSKIIPNLMYDLFCIGTPHESEERIRRIIINFVEKKCGYRVGKDKMGNLWIRVGGEYDEKTYEQKGVSTIFSCHMDTMHNTADPIQLMLSTGPKADDRGFLYAVKPDDPTSGALLGADDKTGCYIMLRMIHKKIPGLYLFHVGEERGCVGSRHIANTSAHKLKHYKRAIAFDRMHYNDVIHTQRGDRLCSVEFADGLAAALNTAIKGITKMDTIAEKYVFTPCTGVFTDTANYSKDVPEITNLSVGYFGQHSELEKQDWEWLKSYFLPALFTMDWEALPTKRDPKYVAPVHHYHSNRGSSNNYGGGEYGYDGEWSGNGYMANIPYWVPANGYPVGITPGEMRQRVHKYVKTRGHNTVVDGVMDLVLGVEVGTSDVMKLEDGIDKLLSVLDKQNLSTEVWQSIFDIKELFVTRSIAEANKAKMARGIALIQEAPKSPIIKPTIAEVRAITDQRQKVEPLSDGSKLLFPVVLDEKLKVKTKYYTHSTTTGKSIFHLMYLSSGKSFDVEIDVSEGRVWVTYGGKKEEAELQSRNKKKLDIKHLLKGVEPITEIILRYHNYNITLGTAKWFQDHKGAAAYNG